MSTKDENEFWSDALTPEPRFETDFRVPDNKFAFSPGQLNKLFNPKSLAAFYALGGLHGLEYGLQTDLSAGLSADEKILARYTTFKEARKVASSQTNGTLPPSPQYLIPPAETAQSVPLFAERYRVFGKNVLPQAPKKTFLKLLWDAYNDKLIILLTIAAVVSLSLGIYEAVSGQSQVDWVEGVAVCVAILIVVAVTAGNDWQKQRQFGNLNKRVRISPYPRSRRKLSNIVS
jgi:P-type Ca2+ transporter type 2C